MAEINRPIAVDLFCGAGGMSLGFEQAGFHVASAVDIDPIHVATHAGNFPDCQTMTADITSLTATGLRAQTGLHEVDVLIGGPPCGGFSLIGKRIFDDPRNSLVIHFARLVSELEPKYFVMENVPGILYGATRDLISSFKQAIGNEYVILDPPSVIRASDFGVPQQRKRVFVLGYRRDLKAPEYPCQGDGESRQSRQNNPNVWDAIGDIPNIDDYDILLRSDVFSGELLPIYSRYAAYLRGVLLDPQDRSKFLLVGKAGLTGCLRTTHTDEVVRRFVATQPGAVEPKSRLRRLACDGLCPTLRAGSDRNHGSYTAARPIHPVYPRCISVREAARMQSFPDWFTFHHTKWHGFRQVGNSVPPLLARAVAYEIYKAIYTVYDNSGYEKGNNNGPK